MRLRWTAPALRDLEAIGDYIARDNPAAAARVVTDILDRTDRLAKHPHIGRPGRVPETRELVVTKTALHRSLSGAGRHGANTRCPARRAALAGQLQLTSQAGLKRLMQFRERGLH